MTTRLDYFITKRDGRVTKFDENKIHSAIHKAICAIGKPNSQLAEKVLMKVMESLFDKKQDKNFSVEDIQDAVEQVLIELGIPDVAKAYILYRDNQRLLRAEKCNLLNRKDLDEVDKTFDLNSLRVLASRYLLRNDKNEIIESPKELFIRVATHVGLAEIFYDPLLVNNTNIAFGGRWDLEAEEYYGKLDNFDNKLHIGKYYLNKYHFEALIRQYVAMFKEGKIKAPFKHLLELIVAGHFNKVENMIDRFYNLMVDKVFLPNTPTLMNAGAKLQQLSACFVIPIDDNLDSIMKAASDCATIFKSGGGIGINYSNIRPEGDVVFSTSGVASGPLSFMQIVNTVTEVVKQGGKRRGANMGILNCDHPDIEKFITAKTTPGVLENFNVSVGLWKQFWDAYKRKGKFALINPRNNKMVKEIDAVQLMEMISLSAWKSAEPGVIFFDNINKYNRLINARGGPIKATNPCSEIPLFDYEPCNLGSINLAKLVTDDEDPQFDWIGFERIIRICVRFLDNVIDVNKYPIQEITKASREIRRIGLGIMGLSDLLYILKIPYNSQAGYDLMNLMAESFAYYATDESIELAKERGVFSLFDKSEMYDGKLSIAGVYEKSNHNKDWKSLIEKMKVNGIRNAWVTTIAPTGSLSMIADTSSGVEPAFSIAFQKKIAVGDFYYSNKIFKDTMIKQGVYNDELIDKIAHNYGSVKGINEIPKELQEVFVTAMDIHWLDHIVAQAVWQQWIDNAISKTINLAEDATAEDIKNAYLIGHDLGLKGISVYRDNSRHEQVLHVDGERNRNFEVKSSDAARLYVKAIDMDIKFDDSEITQIEVPIEPKSPQLQLEIKKDSNVCECGDRLVIQEGCCICLSCGWSACKA